MVMVWMQSEESMEVSRNKVSNYIPSDISIGILSKLDIKSLKRFTCVCKFWGNLFENPQFMNMYLTNFSSSKYNDHPNSHPLLNQTPGICEFDDNDYIFLLFGETFENKVKLNLPPPLKVYREGISIFGSTVNGILCLFQRSHEVVLWNPSTDEFKAIPYGSFNSTILKAFPPNTVFEDLPDIRTFAEIHGFGYDPITDDYKLIRYFYFIDDMTKFNIYDLYNCINDETLWQIYSLKSNCWRDLQIQMPNNFRSKDGHKNDNAMYFNGMCHWWGYEDVHEEEVLVSFNLSDEVFIITHSNPNYCGFSTHMAVLKDSIAMIEYHKHFYLFISVLGEIGVADSWTRLFRIGPLHHFMELIGVGKNGDIFFNSSNDIERFNLNTYTIEEIGITGRANCCQMIIYNSSILSIEGMHS